MPFLGYTWPFRCLGTYPSTSLFFSFTEFYGWSLRLTPSRYSGDRYPLAASISIRTQAYYVPSAGNQNVHARKLWCTCVCFRRRPDQCVIKPKILVTVVVEKRYAFFGLPVHAVNTETLGSDFENLFHELTHPPPSPAPLEVAYVHDPQIISSLAYSCRCIFCPNVNIQMMVSFYKFIVSFDCISAASL